jgi:hypothetical protein
MTDTDDLTALLAKASTRELECDETTYRELVTILRFYHRRFPKEMRKAMAKIAIDKREPANQNIA